MAALETKANVNWEMQNLSHLVAPAQAGDNGGPRALQVLPNGRLLQASVFPASSPLAQEIPGRWSAGAELIQTQVYQLPDFILFLF